MKDYLMKHKPKLHLSIHPAYLPQSERTHLVKAVFASLDFYNEITDETGQKIEPHKTFKLTKKAFDFGSFFFSR
jgi:hypothetical protein